MRETQFGEEEEEGEEGRSMSSDSLDQLREEAKQLFKSKKFSEAIECYSRALTIITETFNNHNNEEEDEEVKEEEVKEMREAAAQYLTNRSVCYLKLRDWKRSARDSSGAVAIALSSHSEGLSKPLFFLGKALYHRGLVEEMLINAAVDPRKVEELFTDSLAALQYFTLTDPNNEEGAKLAALVAKKVSSVEQARVEDADVTSPTALVSPSRHVVSCTFQQTDGNSISSPPPSVHPVVHRALLDKVLTKHMFTTDKSLSSQETCALLATFLADSDYTISPVSVTNFKSHSGLRVDTCQKISGLEGKDGPITPSSIPAYNMFSPLSPNKGKMVSIGNSDSDGELKFCRVCRDVGDLRCSRCKAVNYCSGRCQSCDWPFHKRQCRSQKSSTDIDSIASEKANSALQQEGGKPKREGLFSSLQSLSPSKFRLDRSAMAKYGNRKTCRGLAGIVNMGNTCYLSSPIQCLSHIFPIVKYFITDAYIRDINKKSIDSTKGVFAKEFANLLKQLWLRRYPAYPTFEPTSFRRVLGNLNRDYAGFQQQDAHDLLAFVLDKLHEDVNLIEKKPYLEASEISCLADEERVGKENWEKHLMRHNSAVQDVVGGFLKSQIVCPLLKDCGKISMKFDYTSTVQLAIPQTKKERERRGRSNSIGNSGGRNRTRTSSGNSQYMETLVSGSRGRASSFDAINIPIHFVTQIPLSPPKDSWIRGIPSHQGVLALSTLNYLQNNFPIEVTVEEFKRTKLFAVKQKLTNALLRCVKRVYHGVDNAPFKRREEGELVLIELEQAPSTGGVDTRGYVTSRILNDKDTVASVVNSGGNMEGDDDDVGLEPVALAAYWLSADQASVTPNFTFLMQKITLEEEDGASEECSRIVGKPLLLPYDASWTCAQFRYAVWRQIQRFISVHDNESVDMLSSDGDEDEEDEEKSQLEFLLRGGLETQMKLCCNLRIRLVDRLGNPQAGVATSAKSESPQTLSTEDELIRSLELNCAEPPPLLNDEDAEDVEHLSYLPYCQQTTLRDFMGDDVDSFSFFSIEYVRGWRNAVSNEALHSVQPLSPDGVLHPPVAILPDVEDDGNSDEQNNTLRVNDPFDGIETDDLVISTKLNKPPKPSLNRVVPHGTVTLEDCLQLYTTEEVLDEANSWYCNQCRTHRQAYKTLQFYKLPPVLIFGLKRFETRTIMSSIYGGGVFREKISSFVDFPLNGLDMSPYSKPLTPPTEGDIDENGVDERYLYDLVAVCNHYGRMGFGHYTAFAREWDGTNAPMRNDSWCCFDDEMIYPVDAKSVKTSAAYILFYRRRKFETKSHEK